MNMNCESIRDMVERWRQGETPTAMESEAARAHALSCASCREEFGVALPLIRRDAEGFFAPPLSPDIEERVMSGISARPPRATSARRWVLAVAASMVLVLGTATGLVLLARDGSRGGMMEVTFTLDTPTAQSVALVGDFNGWKPKGHLLVRRPSDGKWSITLRLLQDRTYVYSFLIDGEQWVPDPSAESVDDGFGGVDSILRL